MNGDVEELVNQLQSKKAKRKALAAEKLAQLGNAAQSAALPLIQATSDAAEPVRQWATSALEDLGPPHERDLACLTKLLGDTQADTAYWAATLLGRLRASAKPALAQLQAAADSHAAPQVRRRASWALKQIG